MAKNYIIKFASGRVIRVRADGVTESSAGYNFFYYRDMEREEEEGPAVRVRPKDTHISVPFSQVEYVLDESYGIEELTDD